MPSDRPKLNAVFFCDQGYINRGHLILSYTAEVVEARRSEATGAHVMHSRDRRVHHIGNLSGAAERVDYSRSKSVHTLPDAITVCSDQAKRYHNSNCRYGIGAVDRSMPYEDIQARMREIGYRQVDLANLLEIWPNAVSKAFAGKRRFTAPEMDKIRNWLGDPVEPAGISLGTIPVIAKVTAGNFREASHHALGRMPKPDPSIPDRALALDVDGDSMDKYVPDGGRIIYDPEDRALWPRRFYVVLNGSGETTFKRFFADPARLEPCSTNPNHRVIELGGDETYTIVGRVIWQASRMPD